VKEEAKEGPSTGLDRYAVAHPVLARTEAKSQDAKGTDRFKGAVLVARRDGFVLVTMVDSKDQLQRVLSARKNITSLIEPAKTWLDEQDVCGAVTRRGRKLGFP